MVLPGPVVTINGQVMQSWPEKGLVTRGSGSLRKWGWLMPPGALRPTEVAADSRGKSRMDREGTR